MLEAIKVAHSEDRYEVYGFYAELNAKVFYGKGIVTATFDDEDISYNGACIDDEMGADVTAGIVRLLGAESDFPLKPTGTYNDRVTGLRSYKKAIDLPTLTGAGPETAATRSHLILHVASCSVCVRCDEER